jgi:hypothetical protein
MVEAVQTSEMLVNSYQTTRRCNPEDSHLQILVSTEELCPVELISSCAVYYRFISSPFKTFLRLNQMVRAGN